MNKDLTYNDIYNYDIEMMKDIQKKYSNEKEAWRIFYEFYVDPDGYPINKNSYKRIKNVECTVDGLLSVNRIFYHKGFNASFIKTYEEFRKTPIFYFPPEKNGINQSRSYKCNFGDRIDYTLYDIKKFFDNNKDAENCILKNAFSQPKTNAWLKKFDSFDCFIREFKLKGSFCNDKGEVINIRTGAFL